jgi:hypothetical protein
MSMGIDWAAKLRKKHARVLNQTTVPESPDDVTSGWRKLVEEHRQALLSCDHDCERTSNDQPGASWCSRCGKRMT